MIHLKLAIALSVAVLAGSSAAAQQPPAAGPQRGAPPAEPPKNLQVLPKDMPREQVINIMRNVNAALGVQCGYCHTFVAPGDPMNDFASDSKPTKLVARVMMQMTGEINQKLAANIKKPADQLTRVGCMTCHRGAAIPVVPPPAPAPGAPAGTPPTPPAAPGR
jgi:hypothetical protein